MSSPRVAPGGLRELGLVNWLFCRLAARSIGVPDVHLFRTLGRRRGLFRGWLAYSSQMMPFGTLSRYETEMVILRVAHLRKCQYEQDHHTRLGRRAGLDAETQKRIVAGPKADGWSARHRALLEAADSLVGTKNLGDDAWDALSAHYSEQQMIEIVMLVGQYDSLATAIGTLRISRDV